MLSLCLLELDAQACPISLFPLPTPGLWPDEFAAVASLLSNEIKVFCGPCSGLIDIFIGVGWENTGNFGPVVILINSYVSLVVFKIQVMFIF